MEAWQSIVDQAGSIFKVITEPIFQISGTHVSVVSLLISVLVVLASVRFGGFVGRMLNRRLESRAVDSGVRDSLEKFTRYLLIGVGVLFALDNLGVSISSLAALGAILMVGIGFGLQNIAQNFISGIIILIERPIKVGDIVSFGNSSGRVVDIRVRSTVVQTRDDVSIIVPNSKLISEEVINDSYSGQIIRRHVRVGVAYGSDVDRVKSLLVQAPAGHPKILAEPPPRAIFEDFGESSLNFDIRFWCSDIWDMDQVCSDVRTKVDALFRANGIEIPFPQRDLHIKTDKA